MQLYTRKLLLLLLAVLEGLVQGKTDVLRAATLWFVASARGGFARRARLALCWIDSIESPRRRHHAHPL